MTGLMYHYTSFDTFLKIVDKRELWASDLRCCNDATETTYGIDHVITKLTEHAEQIRRERPDVPWRDPGQETNPDYERDDPSYWADLVLQAKDTLEQRHKDGVLRVLAVCFSREIDALSQWRAYGGRGCAIGFESDPNAIIADRQHFPLAHKLVELQYGEAEADRVAREIAGQINDTTTTSSRAIDQGRPPYQLVEDVLTRIYTMKHDGFEEEKETRLVLSRPLDSALSLFHEMMRYHVTATGLLVPHLPIPINLSSIKEVWVGPGPHRDDNVRALRAFQETMKYLDYQNRDGYNPEIIPSRTPYR